MCEELQLKERFHLKGNKQRLARVEALIERWKDVFTNDHIKVGKTAWVEPFHIELEPNTTPVRQRSRPLTPEQVQALRQQLDDWLVDGVIEPSDSPWALSLIHI